MIPGDWERLEVVFHSAIELPFLVLLMKGFFDSVPRHLE